MPRYRDDFETSRILSDYIKSIEQDEDSMHKMRLDAVVIMQIYELIFSISANNEDLEGMQDILVRAKKASSCFHRKEAYAIYYNMLSEYYDILLDGFYDTDNQDEERVLNKMLDAIEKTLFYSK